MSPARKLVGLPWPIHNLMVTCATEDLTEEAMRHLSVLALFELGKSASPEAVPLVVAAIHRVGAGTTYDGLAELTRPPDPGEDWCGACLCGDHSRCLRTFDSMGTQPPRPCLCPHEIDGSQADG